MSPEEIRRNWLVGTTCAAKANDVREVMFFNETHIVLKHRSHAEYTGRAYGSSSCTAYARLYRRDELVAAMDRRGAYHLDPIKEWTGRINPRRVLEECAELGVEFKDMTQDTNQTRRPAQPLGASDRHTAMHHTVGATVESLLSEGNSRADLAQALEGAARALRAEEPAAGAPSLPACAQAVLDRWNSPKWDWHKQGPTADLMADLAKALDAYVPAADPALLVDLGKWMHAAYDRPPQTPEVRGILARLDAAIANKASAADPGSDSACLKRVVEVSGFTEHAKSDEDIIDYVARLARTSRVAEQAAPAESGTELLIDGAEAIAVEAFMHATNGGHRDDLYKLPLRSKLRAAMINGPEMKEFIEEAGRKGWLSDTGREPRINLVMFTWRAALNAALAGRAEPPLPRIELELPDGDTRTAKVSWVERNADGYHVCLMVSQDAPKSEAVEIWRARFNTAIDGGEESKWVYVDGAAGGRFVAEVTGRPGWEIQPLVPTT